MKDSTLTKVELLQHIDELQGMLSAAREQIERARTYKGLEAYPCPLCRYENGKFIESCSLHQQIAALEHDVTRHVQITVESEQRTAEAVRKCGKLRELAKAVTDWPPNLTAKIKALRAALGEE